jgi:hypothetical protein
MNDIKTKCINGTLQVGDLVLSTPDDDEYCCLVGRVTAIDILGTPAHDEDNGNETDDIHIDFLAFDYSKKRIKEIENDFSEINGVKKAFDGCPMDDIIMAPCTLIRITDVKKGILNRLLRSGYDAACYCYCVLSKLTEQGQTEPELN